MSYAQQLARRGFYVFPCQVEGKKPLVKWREVSTTNEKEIEALSKQFPGCNWGIDCGKSGYLVLDVDNKKENGYETLKALEINKGYTLPETMEFSTPSGGRHYIFKGPGKTTAGKIGPGLDTRGVGGYIVSPGSSLGSKGVYKVSRNRPIADTPAWITNLTSDTADTTIITKETDIDLDLPHNVQDAVHYLEKRAKPALEGQGGDAQTFKVAAQLRDFGISQEMALELMGDFWNDRCEPPWEFEELQEKVRNAFKYSQNSPGAKTAQAAFDAPIESAFKADEKPEIELLPMMDLTEALSPAPPQEWLLKDWIPSKEMCLFTGKEGTGKSLLALQLAMSAAYGIPWLDQDLERTYQVIYISCEDDKDEIKRRCNAIALLPEYAFLGGDVDPKRFRPVPLVGEDNAMVYEDNWKLEAGPVYLRLNATLNHLGWREPLLIFDTLSDMFMANENNRAMVQHFVKRYLGRFRRDYDATIITLAHPPKSESEYSGSTAWPAAHRSCIGVKQNPSDALPDHRIIELWKANRTTTKGKRMHIEWHRGAFRRVNTFDIPELENLAASDDLERVFDVIEEWASKDQPVGIPHQSENCIRDIPIRDAEGVLMDVSKKVQLAKTLKAEGRVKIARSKNRIRGMYPEEDLL